MSALARTTRKSFPTRFSTESRDRSPSKAAFFEPDASKWCPEGCLGRLWTLLSGSWGALGCSWGALGRSWEALGALLGRSWAALGRSWGALWRSWALLGAPWAVSARFLIPRGSILSVWGSISDPLKIDWNASWRRVASDLRAACR